MGIQHIYIDINDNVNDDIFVKPTGREAFFDSSSMSSITLRKDIWLPSNFVGCVTKYFIKLTTDVIKLTKMQIINCGISAI